MSYTKNDIFILNAIHKIGGVNELSGVPIASIVTSTHLSHTKIRSTVKILQSQNLISEGFMQKNAKTYYISDDGKELLKKFVKVDGKNE